MFDGAPKGYGILSSGAAQLFRHFSNLLYSDSNCCSLKPHLVLCVSIFVINVMGIHWLLSLFFCQLGDSQISIRGTWWCEDLRHFFTLKKVSVLKMFGSYWSRSSNSEIFLQRKDIFSLLQRTKSGSDPYHTSSLMGTGYSFYFSGCLSGGAWGSRLLSSVKFRNKWVYTSTPPYAYIAYKDIFCT